MKTFLFFLMLSLFMISFPYGFDKKEDNLIWQTRKVISLVKKAYPVVENATIKLFNSGKNIAYAAKEEIEE